MTAGGEETYVALLRGINVGGKNKLPMTELRTALAEAGCSDVRTYIQSGNVVLRSASSARELSALVTDTIERRFGIASPVVVRGAADWAGYVRGNPFPEEAATDAGHVLLVLSEGEPASSAAAELSKAATMGERVERVGDAIWIHFAGGVARSKLASPLLDRHIGSPTTARNWRTVAKLHELAQGDAAS